MKRATDDLAALAKKLPEGRLYGNGRGFVPNVRQSLYSEIIVALAVEPQAAVGKDQDEPPVATGLPRTWDDIAPGHLVIAQEALEYGWSKHRLADLLFLGTTITPTGSASWPTHWSIKTLQCSVITG